MIDFYLHENCREMSKDVYNPQGVNGWERVYTYSNRRIYV